VYQKKKKTKKLWEREENINKALGLQPLLAKYGYTLGSHRYVFLVFVALQEICQT